MSLSDRWRSKLWLSFWERRKNRASRSHLVIRRSQYEGSRVRDASSQRKSGLKVLPNPGMKTRWSRNPRLSAIDYIAVKEISELTSVWLLQNWAIFNHFKVLQSQHWDNRKAGQWDDDIMPSDEVIPFTIWKWWKVEHCCEVDRRKSLDFSGRFINSVWEVARRCDAVKVHSNKT